MQSISNPIESICEANKNLASRDMVFLSDHIHTIAKGGLLSFKQNLDRWLSRTIHQQIPDENARPWLIEAVQMLAQDKVQHTLTRDSSPEKNRRLVCLMYDLRLIKSYLNKDKISGMPEAIKLAAEIELLTKKLQSESDEEYVSAFSKMEIQEQNDQGFQVERGPNGKIETKTTGTLGDIGYGRRGLIGHATKERIDPDGNVKDIVTGTWEDRGNHRRGLTGFAVRVKNGPRGKVIRTGTWGNIGNGQWGLTGGAKEENIGIDGKIQARYTGTWGIRSNGRWGFTGFGTEELFGADGKVKTKIIGTWGDLPEGTLGLIGRGVRQEIASDGTTTTWTGTWGKVGNKKWNLTGEGTKKKIDPEGNVLLEVKGIWVDTADGKLDITGQVTEVRRLFGATVIRTGIWGDTGNGWGFTGPGIQEEIHPDGRKIRHAGTWGFIENGLEALTGYGTTEVIGADGNVERRMIGTYGSIGDGTWGLIGK